MAETVWNGFLFFPTCRSTKLFGRTGVSLGRCLVVTRCSNYESRCSWLNQREKGFVLPSQLVSTEAIAKNPRSIVKTVFLPTGPLRVCVCLIVAIFVAGICTSCFTVYFSTRFGKFTQQSWIYNAHNCKSQLASFCPCSCTNPHNQTDKKGWNLLWPPLCLTKWWPSLPGHRWTHHFVPKYCGADVGSQGDGREQRVVVEKTQAQQGHFIGRASCVQRWQFDLFFFLEGGGFDRAP